MLTRSKNTENKRPRFDDLEDLVTPQEAQAFLGLSRSTMYERLRDGSIPYRKYGRLLRIPKSALDPETK
jgi:excisionase family DNA binding protein